MLKTQLFAPIYEEYEPPNGPDVGFQHLCHHACVKPQGFSHVGNSELQNTQTVDSVNRNEE